MKAGKGFLLLVFSAVLLANCGSLEIPGETKASGGTKSAAMNGIRSIEKELYKCAPSTLAVTNTSTEHMFGVEYIEKWNVSSCTGEEHAYIVSYMSEVTQTLVYHKRAEENGATSSMLWSGGGNIKNSYIAKETIRAFDREVEAIRFMVLNESPEMEALQQKGKGEQYAGKHWLSLCETPLLKFKAMRIESALKDATTGLHNNRFSTSHCYQWYGTRRDWKDKVLRKQIAP